MVERPGGAQGPRVASQAGHRRCFYYATFNTSGDAEFLRMRDTGQNEPMSRDLALETLSATYLTHRNPDSRCYRGSRQV